MHQRKEGFLHVGRWLGNPWELNFIHFTIVWGFSLLVREIVIAPLLLSTSQACSSPEQSKGFTFPTQCKSSSAETDDPTVFLLDSHSVMVSDSPSVLKFPKEESNYQKKKKWHSGSCVESISNFELGASLHRVHQPCWSVALCVYWQAFHRYPIHSLGLLVVKWYFF